MTDSTQHRGQPDRSRISLSQDYEVRYWTEKFGCSEDELRKAIAQVGNSPLDVEKAVNASRRRRVNVP